MSDVNDVIEFIAADAARGAAPPAAQRILLPLAMVALSTAAALALRAEYADLQSAGFVVAAGLLLAVLATATWVVLAPANPRRWRYLWLCVSAAMLLSLARDGFPLGTRYADAPTFWRAAGSCFTKGLATSFAASLILTFAVFRRRPLPSARWQVAFGTLAGLAGVAMLTLHCGSAHWGHILAGHWAQALPLVIWSVCLQRWLVGRQLRRLLGERGGRLARPERLMNG